MTDRLAEIHLHGPLADQFGSPHRLAVRTPVEAIRALDANYPGFLAAFASYEAYGLYADGDWREGDQMGVMPFSRELHICPVIEGRAFVGAALVTAVTGLTGITATIIGGVLMAGLMIGLSMLLMPKAPKQDDTRDENYAFTGPENVSGQGVAVPLIYGRVHAGSVVISAGLDLGTDLASTVDQPGSTNPGWSTAIPPGLDPPYGGWPVIEVDRWGRPGPKGWNYIGSYSALSSKADVFALFGVVSKKTDLWQHPISRGYYWNRERGFYYTKLVGQWPQENDWREGNDR